MKEDPTRFKSGFQIFRDRFTITEAIPLWVVVNVAFLVWASYEVAVFDATFANDSSYVASSRLMVGIINASSIPLTFFMASLMGYLLADFKKAVLAVFVSNPISIVLGFFVFQSLPKPDPTGPFSYSITLPVRPQLSNPLLVIGLASLLIITGVVGAILGAYLGDDDSPRTFRMDWRLSGASFLPMLGVIFLAILRPISVPVFDMNPFSNPSLIVMISLMIVLALGSVLLSLLGVLRPKVTSLNSRNLLIIGSVALAVLALSVANQTQGAASNYIGDVCSSYPASCLFLLATWTIIASLIAPTATVLATVFRPYPSPSQPFHGLKT